MSKETVDKSNENKKAYELAFHLVPSLGDDKVNKVFEEITKLVEKNEGKIVSKSEPALLDLEYQMEKTVDSVKMKFNSAYFAWVIFEDGDVIKLKEDLDANKNILRFLIIKTEQKDSIPSAEVAQIINGSKREERGHDEEKVEEVEEIPEVEETEEPVEETPDSAEGYVEAMEDIKSVDEAIDELVK